MDVYKAQMSTNVMYFVSAGDSFLLKNPSGSQIPHTFCSKTPPIARSDATDVMVSSAAGTGCFSIVAGISACFTLSNANWHSSD